MDEAPSRRISTFSTPRLGSWLTFVDSVGTPASPWLIGWGVSRRPLSNTSVLLEEMPRNETELLSPRAVAPATAASLPGKPVICGSAVSSSEGWEAPRISNSAFVIRLTGSTFSISIRLMFEPVTVNVSSFMTSSGIAAADGAGAVCMNAQTGSETMAANEVRHVQDRRPGSVFIAWLV